LLPPLNEPFALLKREGRECVEILTGAVGTVDRLAGIPLSPGGPAGPQTLAPVPYRQVRERGFEAVDDGAPLQVLRIAEVVTEPGPYLKEVTHLTHTEYLLAGRTTRDVRDVLRETMFAPTVVGSPSRTQHRPRWTVHMGRWR